MADELEHRPVAVLPPIEVAAPIVHTTAESRQLAALRSREDGILGSAMEVLEGTLAFKDIDPQQDTIPPEWADMDPDLATRRLRLARAAWLPVAEAPIGMKLAKDLAVGIIKARSMEKSTPRPLNVAIQIVTSPPQFPSRVVDE